MAKDNLTNFRLALMNKVLPVGAALINRARKDNPKKVFEFFMNSDNPLADLKHEGDPLARSVRNKLDDISPGLGNPVIPVEVQVDIEEPADEINDASDYRDLLVYLNKLEEKLNKLDENIT
tara:strand:- start:660 stop:1022 length:363 start_codon:yes stop_codon:yes gene_type:complete